MMTLLWIGYGLSFAFALWFAVYDVLLNGKLTLSNLIGIILVTAMPGVNTVAAVLFLALHSKNVTLWKRK